MSTEATKTMLTPEETTRVAELREVYEQPPIAMQQALGDEDPLSQGPAVRFLLALLDKQLASRQYGRDIINDMTLEAAEADKRIAELEQRLRAAESAVPGVQLAWVVPSTTTGQPGYYTPIYSAQITIHTAPAGLPYDAHGGTSHLQS